MRSVHLNNIFGCKLTSITTNIQVNNCILSLEVLIIAIAEAMYYCLGYSLQIVLPDDEKL